MNVRFFLTWKSGRFQGLILALLGAMIFCRFSALLCGGVFVLSRPALAQDDEPKVEPDRRDFTRGASVIPLGHIQVESGVTATRTGDMREFLLGDTQIRVPISRRAELRFNTPRYLIERESGSASRGGLDDTGIEARFLLSKSSKIATAITAFTTLPTGARHVAEHRYQPGAVLATNFTLSPCTNLILNLGGERPTSEQQRFFRLIATAAFRYDASERVNLFSEVYYLSHDEPDGPSQKFADIGAVYFAGNRTAFDARFGVGLDNKIGGPNYFYSVGVSRLF